MRTIKGENYPIFLDGRGIKTAYINSVIHLRVYLKSKQNSNMEDTSNKEAWTAATVCAN